MVAETFLVAWRRLDDVPEDALPWLYAAARNVINNARRAEVRRDALRSRLATSERASNDDDPAPVVEAEASPRCRGRPWSTGPGSCRFAHRSRHVADVPRKHVILKALADLTADPDRSTVV